MKKLRRGTVVATLGALICVPGALSAPPSNDDFANAQAIAGSIGSVTGSNVDATREPGEPNHGLHAGDASIWFRWIAPETRRYEFETCGSTISTTLGVYSGNDVDSLTRVGGHGPDDCGFNSYVAFDAVASTAYHIAVDGPGLPSPEGPVILSWASATPPGNDAFERPRTLTGPSGWFQQQTNAAAGKQAGEPEHAGDVGGASVWFSWTAPSSTLVRFETVTGYDSLLAVYTGSTMEGLTLVAESDD